MDTQQVLVPVKSAWYSKINWTQGIALSSYAFTFWSHLGPDQKATVMGAIAILHTFTTGVLRIWFNGTVNPKSLR
jgi:hypothetical protein